MKGLQARARLAIQGAVSHFGSRPDSKTRTPILLLCPPHICMTDSESPAPRAQSVRGAPIFKATVIYVAPALAVIEALQALLEPFGVPVWVFRAVVIVAVLGYPVVLFTLVMLYREKSREAQGRRLVFGRIGIAVAGMAAIGAGLVLLRPVIMADPLPTTPQAELTLGEQSIAVLPFEAQSEDPKDAWFADGLSQELLDGFGAVGGIRVASRAQSLTMRDKDVSPALIVSELGVATFLDGTVQRGGDVLRVTTRLNDARTGEQLWQLKFDTSIEDVFFLQDSITRAVVDQLQPMISAKSTPPGAAPARVPAQAFGFWLQARGALDAGDTIAADSLLSMALEIEPEFTRAMELQNSFVLPPNPAGAGGGVDP